MENCSQIHVDISCGKLKINPYGNSVWKIVNTVFPLIEPPLIKPPSPKLKKSNHGYGFMNVSDYIFVEYDFLDFFESALRGTFEK